MNWKKKNVLRRAIISVIAVCMLTLSTSCSYIEEDFWDDSPTQNSSSQSGASYSKDLEIQYLDVGQADASLIKLPNSKIVMIDAGGNSTASSVVNNLKNQGVKKIDHLIGTHPHEDHIGGMKKVIENFEIGEFYMPKIDDSQIPTTKTYENTLNAAKNKDLKITEGKAGMKIINDKDLTVDFIAPNSDKYDGLNSYSIVVRLKYGEKGFLFMGDAESDSEEEILNNKYDVSTDVLKCGHHGSHSSSSSNFLNASKPTYAIISCSSDNKYGHPHKETINALDKLGVKTYITAKVGTVTVTCDKKEINIKTER